MRVYRWPKSSKRAIAFGVGMLLIASTINFGCATMISSSYQNVAINSNPPKAQVRVETVGGVEVASGETPLSVKLKRKDEYVVIVKMTGYRENRINISKEINPYVAGNLVTPVVLGGGVLLFGLAGIFLLPAAGVSGLVGFIMDFTSGAAWNLTPERIEVTLQRASNLSHPELVVTIIYEGGIRRVLRAPLEPEPAFAGR
jgi:hypothetical protein